MRYQNAGIVIKNRLDILTIITNNKIREKFILCIKQENEQVW